MELRRIDVSTSTEWSIPPPHVRVFDAAGALTVTFPAAGTVTYACAMDMIRGTITAK